MKCNKCNKELTDSLQKCEFCGNELTKSKHKKLIIVITTLALLLLLSIIIMIVVIKPEETPPFYLTPDDIYGINCYDENGNEISCDTGDLLTEEITEFQKVSVDLNGTDKAIFIVLSGDINKDEDLLLLYDGLYVLSANEAYYTYERSNQVLKNLNWSNAKTIRLLTEEETEKLGCTIDYSCDWLLDSVDNQTGINNDFGHYGFGFFIQQDSNWKTGDSITYINVQGYLIDFGFSDDTHGLRPAITINSKYVELYSTTKYSSLEKNNKSIDAKFVNDVLQTLSITMTHTFSTEEDADKLKDELEAKKDTEYINYGVSSYYFDSYEVIEYITLDCKNMKESEIAQFISGNIKNMTYKEYYEHMMNDGYKDYQ